VLACRREADPGRLGRGAGLLEQLDEDLGVAALHGLELAAGRELAVVDRGVGGVPVDDVGGVAAGVRGVLVALVAGLVVEDVPVADVAGDRARRVDERVEGRGQGPVAVERALGGAARGRRNAGDQVGDVGEQGGGRGGVVARRVVGRVLGGQVLLVDVLAAQIEQRIGGGVERHHLGPKVQHVDRQGDQLVPLGSVPFDEPHAAGLDIGLGRVVVAEVGHDAPGRQAGARAWTVEGVVAPLDQLDGVARHGLAAGDQPPGRVEARRPRAEDGVGGSHDALPRRRPRAARIDHSVR
jgi:hypothetical protein